MLRRADSLTSHRRVYFFKLDLLGGEPLWQVPHGLPFAIWGVAYTLDIINEFIASARKKTNPAPMTLATIPVLVTGCMSPSNLSARAINDDLLKHNASTLRKKRRCLSRTLYKLVAILRTRIVGGIVGRSLKSAVVKPNPCIGPLRHSCHLLKL